jgi:type I restriction enzyme R subunit
MQSQSPARPEAKTRQESIDRQLALAGWTAAAGNLTEELIVRQSSTAISDGKAGYRTPSQFLDYALLRADRKPIAIVEAKHSGRDAVAGKRQAADYADQIQKQHGFDPFIFLANGQEILFWDRSLYPPRRLAGFYTPDDLERLRFQRIYRADLSQVGPNRKIIDRDYQIEAVKRVTEAMQQAQRKFLLVMATGTGKTRTVIALIDLLMRAKWVQRVLFLADRRELVRQALGDFKEHMPNETRTRIEGGEVDSTSRIHVTTYPSMMQVYQTLSPGYYDLIVADESHRSIYNRYKALFDHFDSLQLGLTATPTDSIDHNTFELFECPDGLPTFNYAYEAAVEEGYLAPYRVFAAQTTFQIEGIKAGQLPPELQHQLEEQGIELSELDFEGSDLERRVTNSRTTDAMVQEIMDKCRKDASRTLPAKTIVFAISHAHAVRLWESFNRLYPELQRQGMAEIVDSHMERADQTLDDFKRKSMPRIAISVDMLDTGIDVPAVQTLVFAKPVFSQVKFWQMIGRGTRRWKDPQTGEQKTDFLIIDFWNNFAYFNMNPEADVAKPTEPLPTRLFRLRLDKLVHLRGLGDEAHAAQTVAQLQEMLATLPQSNVNVRPHLEALQALHQPEPWQQIDQAQAEHLSTAIAPLLRFLPDVQLEVMTFAARTERLALAHLAGDTAAVQSLRDEITEDLKLLPATLGEVQAQAEKLAWAVSAGFWEHLEYDRIMDLQATFAPLMRYRRRRRPEMLVLNLPDEIARRRWILYGPSGEGAFADTYRQQVEAAVKALARDHPTLEKLRRGLTITEDDVQALADALNRPDLFIREATLQQVYEQPAAGLVDFVRHILGLSQLKSREEAIRADFDKYLAQHPEFTSTQLQFLRAVRAAVIRRAVLTTRDLERLPFARIGDVHHLFTPPQVDEVLAIANRLAA